MVCALHTKKAKSRSGDATTVKYWVYFKKKKERQEANITLYFQHGQFSRSSPSIVTI